MQVKLNGRLFPVAEASSKKVAKKDAAAATLRILMKEMSGDSDTMEEENSATVEALSQVADIGVSFCLFAVRCSESHGISFKVIVAKIVKVFLFSTPPFNQASTEGSGQGEGTMGKEHPPPLSRSLPGGKNPVSVLMEYSQRSGNPIEFLITGQAGPPHDPRYQPPPPPQKKRHCSSFCTHALPPGGCYFCPGVSQELQSADTGTQPPLFTAIRVLLSETNSFQVYSV